MVCMHAHMHMAWKPGEGVGSRGAGVVGDCELLGVGARVQTWVSGRAVVFLITQSSFWPPRP